MTLVLTKQHLSDMSAHAERVYPEECCGLILGQLRSKVDPVQKQLVRLELLTNDWTEDVLEQTLEEDTLTKRRRYWIDPKEMLRVQREARDEGLNIIGVYHSHPDHVAVPSDCDRTLAWPDYAYVIVSVCNGKAVDVQNWALDSDHQFQPEPMIVSPSLATESATESATDHTPVSA
ncbi:MAG: M67 family metallopeptidase [Cyanobacteria bacterium J06631_9]